MLLAMLSPVGFTDEATIDLGVVHYSDAPKTWILDVPENIVKVEIGLYGKGQTQINKYAGWNGYMKLNGNYIWRMLGLDSSGVAIIEDSILGQNVSELSGRSSWIDITGVVEPGENTLTYYHYTGGGGAGVKVHMMTSGDTDYSGENEPASKDEILKQTGYTIDIISSELGYFATTIKGRLTNQGRGVGNVQIGVEDPLKSMSLLGPFTDDYGYFTYLTNPYVNYQAAEEFLFAYGDAQEPYVIAQRFTQFKPEVYKLEENKVYENLSVTRKTNIEVYQKAVNGTAVVETLSDYEVKTVQQDLMEIMIESNLVNKVATGMEIVDWAGSVGMCAKGIVAAGPTGGASTVVCAPLGVKLVNEGVDVSTDILVDGGYISGESAKLIDEASNTATSCISITDPIDTASCLGAIVSGGLHVVSYELETNYYGQDAVVVKLSKEISGAVDYALVIVDIFN